MAVITIDEAISQNGYKQKDLYTLLAGMATNLTLLAATLNADIGVTAIDYAGVTLDSTKLTDSGISQGAVLEFLNGWITAFNVILPKLDTDGLTDSDYNSTLAITDVISANAAGDGQTYLGDIGINMGTLVGLLKTCVTNLNALNAKLDADGTVNTATYASTCNITDSIYLV